MTGRIALATLASCALLGAPVITRPALAGPAPAPARPSESQVKEAGKHFARGVQLFGEADYRAALVEFRRAYEIAPNAAVLYNLGQTYYQLQNYAAALTALDRYLNESPATATHRAEVEKTIETLRARVGKVQITTDVPDAEVTIDDELVGKTPFDQPILVSIGRRKITAIHAGRTADTRFVDVAAGDTVKLALSLPDPNGSAAGPAGAPVADSSLRRHDLILPGWIATGVLGAGAITTGTLALLASHDLSDAKKQLGATHAQLDDKASKVKTLSLVADILGAAAIITGGITLSLKLTDRTTTEVHVAVTPTSIIFAGALP